VSHAFDASQVDSKHPATRCSRTHSGRVIPKRARNRCTQRTFRTTSGIDSSFFDGVCVAPSLVAICGSSGDRTACCRWDALDSRCADCPALGNHSRLFPGVARSLCQTRGDGAARGISRVSGRPDWVVVRNHLAHCSAPGDSKQARRASFVQRVPSESGLTEAPHLHRLVGPPNWPCRSPDQTLVSCSRRS
jgi:hypothetical protein